ncbi:hypothetical protein IZ6_25050 [Terrihabitans soli]|uniref:Tip attachment protein J domain-containing protein n=1 Tax=Terrihabitans soli TaxID=708113 RepID=A0A6S6QXK9_9HYPH|nr:phage tail protein [Terrihabitans soli]BCJ91770.1 hypothetical protein IZ6_25050 [Terrihabitans soli]
MTTKVLAFAGSKGAKQPKRTPDNLFSTDVVEAILGLSEGPILGLENGPRSFLIGETPLVSVDGKNNFDTFELTVNEGHADGELIVSRLGGFGSSTSVGTDLASAVPVVRSGTHENINFIDIRLVINRLVIANSKGDFEATGEIKIEYKKASASTWSVASNSPSNSSGGGSSIFFGLAEDNLVLTMPVPGDRATYRQNSAPFPSAEKAIWFDANDDNRPYVWKDETSEWLSPQSLVRLATYWQWQELSAWGSDKIARAYLGARPTVADQSDYWLPADDDSTVKFYNGASFITAGSTYEPSGAPIAPDGVIRIKRKTTSAAVVELRLPVQEVDEPYDIRVTKLSPENTTEYFFDVSWESFQEITSDPLRFPGLASAHLVARASDQFSSLPDLSGIYCGRTVKVPTNYDPVERTYTGVWDGTWKIAFTDNPAFVGNDLVENTRYGINAYYPLVLNKWDVYEAGKWCDIRRADGEPRFTFNSLISDPRPGREMAEYIFGVFGGRLIDDGNGSGRIMIDRDTSAVKLFTPENVVDGVFTFSRTETDSRFNDITVTFTNPDLGWKEDRRRVSDESMIAEFGRVPHPFIAVGCIYEKEAIARGRYKLCTATTETTMVTFKTNRQALYLTPYDIVLIADADNESGITGRIKAVTGARTVSLRDPVSLEVGVTYKINFETPTGIVQRTISNSGAVTSISVTADLPTLPAQTVFSIEAEGVIGTPLPFRVIDIEEAEDNPDDVTVTAIEVNRLKWLFVDGLVDDPEELPSSDLGSSVVEPIGNLRLLPSRSMVGTRVVENVTLDWDPSPSKLASRFRVYQSINDGPMASIGETSNFHMDVRDLAPANYVFGVAALNIFGQEAPLVTIPHFLIGDERPVPQPDTLRLVDEASDTIFERRSPTFEWTIGDAPLTQYYRVRILDAVTDTVIREELVTQPTYTYEYTRQVADGGGTPRRSFKLSVTAVDQFGNESAALTEVFENPQLTTVTGLTLDGGVLAITAAFNMPSVEDFGGVQFHVSMEGSSFDPDETTLVYDGRNTSITFPVESAGMYFVKIGPYDNFRKDDITFSTAVAVIVHTVEVIGGNDLTDAVEDLQNRLAEALQQAQDLAAMVAEQDAGNEIDRQILLTRLTRSIDDVSSFVEDVRLVAVEGDSALAAAITRLSATVGEVSASVSSEAAARADADEAIAQQITDVTAQAAEGLAGGRFKMTAVSSPVGVLAEIEQYVKIQPTDSDQFFAGEKLQVYEIVGTGERKARKLIDVDSFLIGRTEDGVFQPVFAVEDGEVRLDVANIGTVTSGIIQSPDGKFIINLNAGHLIIYD